MESCRLIMLVGLPQSGKSTWAVQQNYPIVSPEAVGLTLYGQLFPVSAKPITWAFAKVMVDILFTAGHDTIILDATNITRKGRDEWKSEKYARYYKNMHTIHSSLDKTLLDINTVELCKERARETCIDDAHYERLCKTIDRMADQIEPVNEEEEQIIPWG